MYHSGMDEYTEAEWKAYHDANSLADAKVITGDPKRLKAAEKMAEHMAKEKTEEAEAMTDIAGGFYDHKTSKAKRGDSKNEDS